MVIEVLHLPFSYKKRFFVIVEVHIGHILLTFIGNLIIGRAAIGFRSVGKGRELLLESEAHTGSDCSQHCKICL